MVDGSNINQREIRVIGMSRSGNHAIINWILQQHQQAGSRYAFLNCAEPRHCPYWTSRPLEHGRPFETNIAGFDLQRERHGHHTPKDLLLHSYEDVFLRPFAEARTRQLRDSWTGTSAHRLDLLILRDPYNLFASRRKLGLVKNTNHTPTAHGISKTHLRIWKQHANQSLGLRKNFRDAWLPVSFNRWSIDPQYRREITAHLGVEFTDAGFQTVAKCAGGSSFDGVPALGNTGLKIHERWRHFADDPSYQAFFDDETHALAREIFGDLGHTPSNITCRAIGTR